MRPDSLPWLQPFTHPLSDIEGKKSLLFKNLYICSPASLLSITYMCIDSKTTCAGKKPAMGNCDHRSQKRRPYTLVHNSTKYWLIFTFLLSDLAENL